MAMSSPPTTMPLLTLLSGHSSMAPSSIVSTPLMCPSSSMYSQPMAMASMNHPMYSQPMGPGPPVFPQYSMHHSAAFMSAFSPMVSHQPLPTSMPISTPMSSMAIITPSPPPVYAPSIMSNSIPVFTPALSNDISSINDTSMPKYVTTDDSTTKSISKKATSPRKKRLRTMEERIKRDISSHPVTASCGHTCKKLCSLKFDEQYRLNLNTEFWNMLPSERKVWVRGAIIPKDKKRQTSSGQSRRALTYEYRLRGTVDDIPVCKRFFLATLGFKMNNDSLVRTAFKLRNRFNFPIVHPSDIKMKDHREDDEPSDETVDIPEPQPDCEPPKKSPLTKTKRLRTIEERLLRDSSRHPVLESCGVFCKKLCSNKFDEQYRQKLNKEFWKMLPSERKIWVRNAVLPKCKKRLSLGCSSRRSLTYEYRLRGTNGNLTVCKTFFLTTLGFKKNNDQVIQAAMRPLHKALIAIEPANLPVFPSPVPLKPGSS